MDVEQMKHFVKINCGKYINKLTKSYPWLHKEMSATRSPPTLPFQSDSAYINKLIHSDTPEQTEKQWQELEKNGRKI
jgi:hypothetical protein